jgi:sRNA-binding regulator protein Hfq
MIKLHILLLCNIRARYIIIKKGIEAEMKYSNFPDCFLAKPEGILKTHVEEQFLQKCVASSIPVEILYLDERCIAAIILDFDDVSIFVDHNGSRLLIYKQALAHIRPQMAVKYVYRDKDLSSEELEALQRWAKHSTYYA